MNDTAIPRPPRRPARGVRPGRFTADLDGRPEMVVFLVGRRINHPLRVWRWWPPLLAMTKMLRELSTQPDSGFLRFHVWLGRTILVLQYWESFDKLTGFARSAEQRHLPAWRAFNEAIADSGEVGIWHET